MTNSSYLQFESYWNGSSWGNSLPKNWKQISGGYEYNVPSGGGLKPGISDCLYIKYKVIKTSKQNDDNQTIVTNKVTITQIKNRTGHILYNNSRNYMNSLSKESSDKFRNKVYQVEIKKDIKGDSRITSYYELGDTITYEITVTNKGNSSAYGNLKDIWIKDQYNSSDLTLSKWNINDGWSLNLSGNEELYIYNGTISPGQSVKLELTFTITKPPIKLSGTNVNPAVTESVSIVEIENKNNQYIYRDGKISGTSETNYMMDTSTLSASKTVYLKIYQVSIQKTVDKQYAEPGEKVTYTIKVNNKGNDTTNYGNIKNIKIKDIYNKNELTLVETNVKDTDWTQNGDVFTYNNSVSPRSQISTSLGSNGYNSTQELKLVFKVNKKSKTNVKVNETVRITQIQNKNGKDIYTDSDGNGTSEKNYTSGSNTFFASVDVTVKIYKLDITKSVYRIYNKNGQEISSKTEAEMGDTVVFLIEAKNSGDNNNLYGNIDEIVLSDYFDNRYLEYVKIDNSEPNSKLKSLSYWNYNGGLSYTNEPKTELKFKHKDPTVSLAPSQSESSAVSIAPGGKSKFYVYMKVKEDINPNDLANDITVTNTAEIKPEDSVKNKYNTDIRDVLNGTLKDNASVKILSYKISVNKYITKYNNASLSGRDKLSLQSRNNSPVEVEKGDSVTYTIKLENKHNSVLKNITFKDIMESGIEVSSNFARGGIITAKKSTKTGTQNVRIKLIQQSTNIQTRENEIELKYEDTLQSGEYILIEIECQIMKTNMYLPNLKNQIIITSVQNRNEVDVSKALNYTENKNNDYLRLKNLVISGTVWLDSNTDGKISNGEKKLSGIEVILHDDTNKKIATTRTDNNGKYNFSSSTNGTGSGSSKVMIDGDGRVVKATNRDDKTGNYSANSKYINYYIEFRYNGVQYKSTPTYSGRKNINQSNNSYNTAYMTDSNAIEYEDQRGKLDKSLEIIGYNQAWDKNGTRMDLQFTKDGHKSTLSLTDQTAIGAYSFVKGKNYGKGLSNGSNIDMLFFNANSESAETDYLKFINLGLVEIEKVDLELRKDLLYSTVIINNHELNYDYGQIGKTLYYRGTEGKEEPYEMKLYKSDYYYRCDKYKNAGLKDESTELELYLTYKITITNNSKTNTKAKIYEIVDFYSDQMGIESIIIESEDAEMYYYSESNNSGIKVQETSNYNKNINYNFSEKGYKTIFISGKDGDFMSLAKGESKDITIVYKVSKSRDKNRAINMNDKINVAQISAYGAKLIDNAGNEGISIIDQDSNAGNINKSSNKSAVDIDGIEVYDDNAFRIKTELKFKNGTSPDKNNPSTPVKDGFVTGEREISGIYFEDLLSELADGFVGYGVKNNINKIYIQQNVGNGLYDERYEDKPEEYKDKLLQGMTVELIEIIEKGGKIYEETLDYDGCAQVKVQTDSDGIYSIKSFIPGDYIIRFRYGDKYIDKKITENSLIHNGQDYKSTTYNLSISDETPNKEKLKELTNEETHNSDARDNEYRRLEIMSYSETMTNKIAESFKYDNYENYKNKDVNNVITVGENDDYLNTFIDSTNGFADTVKFTIGIENELIEKLMKQVNGKDHIDFKEHVDKKDAEVAKLTYKLPNIDFGISYRPENLITLEKKIKSMTLKTSTGEVLVSVQYDKNGNKIGTSQGLEKVQSMDSTNELQGFRYINVDEDLMQGATISIEYYIIATNQGEIDTVNKNLIDGGGPTKIINDMNTSKMSYFEIDKKIHERSYYGKYLGIIYYKGKNGFKDEKAEDLRPVPIRVEKIIDWVDNDATFNAQNNNTKNKYWVTTTEEELNEAGLTTKYNKDKKYVDDKQREYTTDLKKNIVVNATDSSVNEELIKDIIPKQILLDEKNEKQVSEENVSAYITIEINSVLGAGTENDKMSYENIAEVAQFYTIVGRRTNFASTIGNLDLTAEGKTPFYNASKEPDSTGTEVVTLIPPTGLTKYKLFMAKHGTKILISLVVVSSIMIGYVLGRKKIFKKKVYK